MPACSGLRAARVGGMMSVIMDFDTIVLGGGPAGLSTAIRRAASGDRVLVIEQRDLPQTKCCGEFLHPSAVLELNRLLSAPVVGNPITRARICAGKTFREFSIAASAMALDRPSLSLALLTEAKHRDVEILTGHGAEIRGAGPMTVQTGQKRLSAKRVVIAEGPASPAMRLFRKPPHSAEIIYGFSMRVASDQGGLVALAALRRGYAGLCDVGAGALNVAGLLSAGAYRRLAPSHPRFGERLLAEIPAWEGIIPKDCVASIIQAPATAAIASRREMPCANILPVGDAAGMSETAFGDGIARALRQSRFLDESLRMFPSDAETAARAYFRQIRIDSHRPDRRILKIAARLLRTPPIVRVLLRCGTPILRYLAKLAVRPTS